MWDEDKEAEVWLNESRFDFPWNNYRHSVAWRSSHHLLFLSAEKIYYLRKFSIPPFLSSSFLTFFSWIILFFSFLTFPSNSFFSKQILVKHYMHIKVFSLYWWTMPSYCHPRTSTLIWKIRHLHNTRWKVLLALREDWKNMLWEGKRKYQGTFH